MTSPIKNSPGATNSSVDLSELLGRRLITASVPCRVDCGNTLDIRMLSLLLQANKPCTINIAIDLRTTVKLFAYNSGRIKISSSGFRTIEFSLATAPLTSPMGLIAAILYHFQVHGLHIRVTSNSPPRSGLGGSGALGVCVIAAVGTALAKLGRPKLSRPQQICLAQNIEEGLGKSRSGLQDQAAAMYGGVNSWHWDYTNIKKPFSRDRLLKGRSIKELEKHILIAHTGENHAPSGMTQKWIDDFLAGHNRDVWLKINRAAIFFAEALSRCDWKKAVGYLQEECLLRAQHWPAVFDDSGWELLRAAEKSGCGARFCGGGAGGAIWALGEARDITTLCRTWQEILYNSGGKMLTTKIAATGLQVNITPKERKV